MGGAPCGVSTMPLSRPPAHSFSLGSGKSTLLTTLFRLTELESGHIYIDGVDIAKVGLAQLRARLSIVPQDPTMFMGTVRFNLDPENLCDDAALWRALEHAEMHKAVQEAGGLSAEVDLEGSHFSDGQRQLLCLARAFLRKSKASRSAVLGGRGGRGEGWGAGTGWPPLLCCGD